MNWIEAALLGLVQGFTEYLPISSSGHLEIGNTLLGRSGEESLTFAVIVHTATVCSTLVVLGGEVWKILQGLFLWKWNNSTKYTVKIIISMIPVGIVGLFLKEQVESFFGGGLLIVGIMLLVTALLLTFSYYAKPQIKQNIGFRDALIIGIAQACAVMPGLSRSGSTIATGLLLGIKKDQIAQFSFLMVIPPILGEALLSILKGEFSPAESGIPTLSLVVGFIAAFISGCIACKWMLNIVKKGKLIYFAIYCLIVGVTIIITSLV